MKLFKLLQSWLLLAPTFREAFAAVYEDTRRLRASVPANRDHQLALATLRKRNGQAPEMPEAHNPFVPITPEKTKKRMMSAINKFRAEVCYRMKNENGVDFGTFEKCEEFMEKACNPGKDDMMDGDKHEITSGEGYCSEFFPEAEQKAKEQIEEEDRAAEESAKAPGPAPSPGPVAPLGIASPAPAAPQTPASIKELTGSLAPAPAKPPRFIPGKSGGKPPGKLADDIAYYYKKGGKDPFRLHMDENLKLPTQGYWGKLVSHDDMETATEDWGEEFGPKSGHGTYESHCKKYCDTQWCIRAGYCSHHNKNSGIAASSNIFILVLAVMGTRFYGAI